MACIVESCADDADAAAPDQIDRDFLTIPLDTLDIVHIVGGGDLSLGIRDLDKVICRPVGSPVFQASGDLFRTHL